jgi:hypothetical protein
MVKKLNNEIYRTKHIVRLLLIYYYLIYACGGLVSFVK